MFVTHFTLVNSARFSRYFWFSVRARRIRASVSPVWDAPVWRRFTFSTSSVALERSSFADIDNGASTTTLPASMRAAMVRRRFADSRISTSGANSATTACCAAVGCCRVLITSSTLGVSTGDQGTSLRGTLHDRCT